MKMYFPLFSNYCLFPLECVFTCSISLMQWEIRVKFGLCKNLQRIIVVRDISPSSFKLKLKRGILPPSIKEALRKKSSYSELFWSAFFPHFPAFGLSTKRYSVSLPYHSVFCPNAGKCGRNADHNNSEYELFLRSGGFYAFHIKPKVFSWTYFLKNLLLAKCLTPVPEVLNCEVLK